MFAGTAPQQELLLDESPVEVETERRGSLPPQACFLELEDITCLLAGPQLTSLEAGSLSSASSLMCDFVLWALLPLSAIMTKTLILFLFSLLFFFLFK